MVDPLYTCSFIITLWWEVLHAWTAKSQFIDCGCPLCGTDTK